MYRRETKFLAFQECTSLEKVSCPLVQDIGAKTFYKCSKLTTINNNVLDKVKNIGYSAFFGCKSLRSIALNSVKILSSNVDGYCDSEMQEGTFGYCTNLKSVEIYNVKTIGDGAFYGCTNLSKINRNNVLTSVRYIGKYAFAKCRNLKTINIKSNNFSVIGLNAFKMIGKKPTFNCPKKKVKTYKKLIKPHSPLDSKFVGKFK